MLSPGAQPLAVSELLATTPEAPTPRSVGSPPHAALAQLFNLEGNPRSPAPAELADRQVEPSSQTQVA